MSEPHAVQEPSTTFRGGGHTLGSDDVDSTFVPDPSAHQGDRRVITLVQLTHMYAHLAVNEEEEVAQRNITFWRNGFSIEGGEFYSYVDPENERLLAEINTGYDARSLACIHSRFCSRAPVSVLNVRPGQPVEVIVSKRTNEDYVAESQPFGGAGNRLGSPVPVVTSMPGSFPTASSTPPSQAERTSVTTLFEVDQTQPTTTLQIRLADGTR